MAKFLKDEFNENDQKNLSKVNLQLIAVHWQNWNKEDTFWIKEF